MKIRKALGQINRELLKEIDNLIEDHPCSKYTEEGMGCVICNLLRMGKPLVLLHYVRNKGMVTGHLEGETRLLDLLGTERFKQKVKSEIDMVRNTPKKRCFNCGKIVTMWMPYSHAALILSREKEIGIKCSNCGVLTYFSNKEVKARRKPSDSVRQLVIAMQLAHRLGYIYQNNSEEEELMENENDDQGTNYFDDFVNDPDE